MSRSLEARLAAAEYWRSRVGALDEPFRLAGTSRAIHTAVDRRVIRCALDASARAALDGIARDPLGQCTVVMAALGVALERYWGRAPVVLAMPPLEAERAEGSARPLLLSSSQGHTVRSWLADTASAHDAALDTGGYDAEPRMLPPLDELTDCWVHDVRVHADVSALASWQQATLRVLLHEANDGVLLLDFDAARCDVLAMEDFARQLPHVFTLFADRAARLEDWTPITPSLHAQLSAWAMGDHPADDVDADVDALLAPVHARIADVVRRQPDAIAIRSAHDAWTYAALDDAACRVARAIASRCDDADRDGGLPPIAICMSRSPWLIAAILGVMRTGRAYVPLDPHNPAARVAQVLTDAKVALVLTDGAPGSASAWPCAVLEIDDTLPAAAGWPAVPVQLTDAAYVIYTSGSTGTPKGCVLEHRHIAHYLTWATRYYWRNAPTTMALFTSVAFDMPVTTIFGPLLTGGTLHVIPETVSVDTALRMQFDPASGIDTVKLTPSHIAMLEALRIGQTAVRCAIVGGEAMTAGHLTVLRALSAEMRVVNEYGPTEAAVGCIVDDLDVTREVTIGTPISRMDAWVLDRAGRLVPRGVRGELCVGGAGVARGYLHNAALTKERFLPHPFIPGSRLYRTGDEARWRADGQLESFGRLDGQVKIRGHRIELGEVEFALRACDGIHDACALTMPDGANGYTLAAAVVAVSGAPPVDVPTLRSALRARLPKAMVPSRILVLAALPLNANGKVDRRQLRDLIDLQGATSPVAVEPLDGLTEQGLALLYQRLLGVSAIGADADFIALGGHSLRAMELLAGIHAQFRVEIGLSDVFEARTLRALARRVHEAQPTTRIPIERVVDAPHYPLSHEQRRLWLLDQLEADRAVYNIVAPVQLDGAIDHARLTRAIEHTARRHETLRTTLVFVDGEPRQQVASAPSVQLAHVDCSQHETPMEAAYAWLAREVTTPIEVMYAPLWRITLLTLGATQHVLVLTQHHLITDEQSARQFVIDLRHAYAIDGPLSPLPVQYRDYVAWQQRYLRAPASHTDETYWRTTLADAPCPLALPTDGPRPGVRTNNGARVRAVVPAAPRAALEHFAALQHASPFMAWLALVQVMLRAHVGHDAIWLGAPVAGRHDPVLSEQLGMFVNTVVLTATVPRTQTFRERLHHATQTATRAFEHAAYPFDRVLEALDVPRDPSRSPLFDVLITYESATPGLAAASGLQITDMDVDVPLAKFDLTIGLRESSSGLEVEFEYNRDLFDRSRMTTMLDGLLVMLDDMVRMPDRAIDEFAWFRPDVSGPSQVPVSGSTPPAPPIAAALTPLIDQLRQLWHSVLLVDEIGTDDDFFSLGGDSILALQLVARARTQQVPMTVRTLFMHPTLRALAAAVLELQSAPPVRPASTGGLTPIQHAFLGGDGYAQARLYRQYNQSVLLDLPADVSQPRLASALARVVAAHDAFGLRFVRDAHGWKQQDDGIRPTLELFTYADDADVTAQCDLLQQSLDPEQGPLWRIVLFTSATTGVSRLFLVAHHLVIDGVSWRILLDDVAAAWESPDAPLPAPTLTMAEWSTVVTAWARRDASTEVDYWLNTVRTPDEWPAVLAPIAGGDVMLPAAPAYESIVIDAATTTALLTRAGRAYGTDAQDLLISALLQALSETTGHRQFTMDLEHQGRTALEDIDLSRSVGWYTACYPVRFVLPAAGDPGTMLMRTKDTLRAVPSAGLGFGALRSFALDASVRTRLARTSASVQFNYLGQSDAAVSVPGWRLSDVSTGESVDPTHPRRHALDVTALVQSGCCEITFAYDVSQLAPDAVARLVVSFAAAVQALVEHTTQPGVGALTPSDVPACRLDADALSRVVASVPGDGSPRDRIDDIYDCTPLQEGMLFHQLRGTDGDAYHEQWVFTLEGTFDERAFHTAWEMVVARHAALRTVFRWRDVPHAVQVVLRRGQVQWIHRAHPDADESTLAALVHLAMQEDRAYPFDLEVGPVQRVRVMQGAHDRTIVCWSHHHIILDGWSTQLVIRDVVEAYAAIQQSREPVLVRSGTFRSYVQWQQQRDVTRLRQFWEGMLGDVREPTALPGARVTADEVPTSTRPTSTLPTIGPDVVRLVRTLDAETTARFMQAVRAQRLTASTVIRAAWAMTLATSAQTDDVVFGVTLAGRPPELDGVEQSVGLYIVTVPLRVQVDRGQRIGAWLQSLHQQQADLDSMATLSPTMVHRCSGVSRDRPLFESVVVVENYPLREASATPGNLQIASLDVRSFTHYPLALMLIPGTTCEVALDVDRHRVSEDAAAATLDTVVDWLVRMATEPATPVAAFFPATSVSFDTLPLPETLAGEVTAAARGRGTDASEIWRAAVRGLADWYGSCEELHIGAAVVDTIAGERLASTPLTVISGAREASAAASTWDLRLIIRTADAQLAIASDSGRFAPSQYASMLAHLETLVTSLLLHPDVPLSALSLLTEAEASQLTAWNATDTVYAGPDTLAGLVVDGLAQMAHAHPEHVVVRVLPEARDWTALAFDRRTTRLAQVLRTRFGVQRNVLVGVCAERSSAMMVSLVAVLKAGGAYVPLDPSLPTERLDYQLQDSGVSVVLAQAGSDVVTARLDAIRSGAAMPAIVWVTPMGDEPEAIERDASDEPVTRTVGVNDLAYMIYTSGSTGRPKGALNTQGGVANRLHWMHATYPVGGDDRILQKTPYSFDVSVWELFWPFFSGARLVVAEPGGHANIDYLVSTMRAESITTAHFVPSMLQAFVQDPIAATVATAAGGALRQIFASGEALPAAIVARTQRLLPGISLHNLYGPTEAAVDVSAWTCPPQHGARAIPIGRPIANTQLHVLDIHGRQVPPGVTGALWIGGVQVGVGYHGRPELTAERFQPDPTRPGGRRYRTGDLARWRADGVLEYLGREDHQVKVNGHRIELGEIEAVLSSVDGVGGAIVVVGQGVAGQSQLVAHVELAHDAGDNRALVSSALAACERLLPAYMVPHAVHCWRPLPRLPNGKLDRSAVQRDQGGSLGSSLRTVPHAPSGVAAHAVSEPAPAAIAPAALQSAPRDAVERQLQAMWSDVLQIALVGRDDTFFDLGGDSLLAIRLASRIEAAFNIPVPLATFFDHTTIAQLASMIRAGGAEAAWTPLVAMSGGGKGAPLFLFPGAGGNVLAFEPLVRRLVGTRPIYGLQAVGLDGRTAPLTDVRAMASAVVPAIEAAAGTAAVLLAGHSFGGPLAFEVAQQLRARGTPVAWLGIFDTPAPLVDAEPITAEWTEADWVRRIARDVETMTGTSLGVEEALRSTPLAEVNREAAFAVLADRLTGSGWWPADAPRQALAGYVAVYRANLTSHYRAMPARYHVPITLFTAREQDDVNSSATVRALQREPGWGWRSVMPVVSIAAVPGDHLTMLTEPHVAALASAVTSAWSVHGVSA